ncbi:MAG TPA: acetyl-CoA carboxylase biotin carboxyl carrier protein [Deltaproteobacteria bacterium]|nr:acetyl-CoA carboxylase biotin carboxyl carrier protein [Deltaproteobacteria bacterium]
MTYKDVIDILRIIDDSTCRELHLELGDLKLDLVKGQPVGLTSVAAPPGPSPAATAPPPQETIPEKPVAEPSGIPVRTPLSGTFYRAPAPGAKPFVEVGSRVKEGDQVGIVEVMKLMNSIKAPGNGTIREILVENETKVEMGQVLMTMNPPAGKKKTGKSAGRKKG